MIGRVRRTTCPDCRHDVPAGRWCNWCGAGRHGAHRDPRASLHVTSDDFWQYAVLEADAELSAVAQEPGDAACLELRDYYRSVSGEHDDWDDYDAAMIREGRLVVRLRPTHAYGSVRD